MYTVIPYGSAYAALLCAVSVAMALKARARSGRGQRIEIPLFDATFTAIGARALLVNGKPEVEPEFNWSRQRPCKDGRWLMYVANNRRHTGEGQFVDDALAYTATMLQSGRLQDYAGKRWDEPHGQEATGHGPLDRLHQASDGWLYFAARSSDLSDCAPLAQLAGRGGADLERALGRADAKRHGRGVGGGPHRRGARRAPRRAEPGGADDRPVGASAKASDRSPPTRPW